MFHGMVTSRNATMDTATSANRGPGHAFRVAALGACVAALIVRGSPPLALGGGILFTLVIGHPFAHWNRHVSKWLLQACVILLGFSMDLGVVLRLGMHGAIFAAGTIGATLLLGWWVGRRLGLDTRTSTLISAGTAICGGSAIAAVSSVIGATEAEIAVSIGTVFILNGVALYLFPVLGHLLHLSQAQFGLWAGIAIHDISSVVGASMTYGSAALATATAVKLSRTLWIAPLTLAVSLAAGRQAARGGEARQGVRMTVPWFIGLFLLASLARSLAPGIGPWLPVAAQAARRGMVLVLFLVGSSLSLRSLRVVGWRASAAGLALWFFISAGSLLVIRILNPGA
jgi:uncharacterized integral membrane protein (TIGR00698 family)